MQNQLPTWPESEYDEKQDPSEDEEDPPDAEEEDPADDEEGDRDAGRLARAPRKGPGRRHRVGLVHGL